MSAIKVNLIRIDSEKLKVSEIKNKLKNVSGILFQVGLVKEELKVKLRR